jgi:hypothetical protein
MIASQQLDTASKKAASASQVYLKSLALRIFLKRSEELANVLPVNKSEVKVDLEPAGKDLRLIFQNLLVAYSGSSVRHDMTLGTHRHYYRIVNTVYSADFPPNMLR